MRLIELGKLSKKDPRALNQMCRQGKFKTAHKVPELHTTGRWEIDDKEAYEFIKKNDGI